MFIVQIPQRRVNHSAALYSECHTKTDQQRDYNDVPELDVHQPDDAVNEELPVLSFDC